MGLDIWFREDVARALLAAEQASAAMAAAMESIAGDPRYLRAYREGYKAALGTVATAFGLIGDKNIGAAVSAAPVRDGVTRTII